MLLISGREIQISNFHADSVELEMNQYLCYLCYLHYSYKQQIKCKLSSSFYDDR